MNHYFSRLAQRSSIATPNAGRQSQAVNIHTSGVHSVDAYNANTNSLNNTDTWGEQSVEVNSSAPTLENKDHTTRKAVSQYPTAQSPLTVPVNAQIASEALINSEVNPLQVTASGLQTRLAEPQSIFAGVHYNTVDALANVSADSLSVINHSEILNSPSATGLSPTSNVATSQQQNSYGLLEQNDFTENKPYIRATTQSYNEVVKVEARQKNTIATDNSNTPQFYESRVSQENSISQESQNNKITARPDNAMQSSSPDVAPSDRVGRVASNPIASHPTDRSTVLINIPDAGSRSAVQVNIGKIELEVFSPEKKVVQAPPPPAAPLVKPAQREPIFNSHRHYLRSR